MENKEKLSLINEKVLKVYACIQSLQYIVKDLDEMEMQANKVSNGYYCGLSNIVEQLSINMASEMKDIINLLDQ
ncbi:MAG: hypothetical protein J6I83_02175 [Firmicutes bacterium]|nr:hypothetical protein [Bacillota bacterium]